MGKDNWLLLNRLRRTVEKIRLLLKSNNIINKWRLASMVGAGGATSRNRRLSFNDRPGLRAVCSEEDDDEDNESSNHSGSSRELQRTTSYTSEDDVDKRAEMFIANFYRQLHMERQVSLQLRYCRGNSFDSSVSP